MLIIWSRLTAIPEPETSASVTQESAAQSDQSNSTDFSGQLRITTIIAPGDLQNERVLIEHVGSQDVSLAGWTLEDEDNNRYTFPSLILHPGASIELFSRQGEGSATRLFWNEEDSIWNDSESATLLDPDQTIQASYQIP